MLVDALLDNRIFAKTMMKHLDEATIQAFLDGELLDSAAAAVTQHLSVCESCTDALLKAEAEMAEINFAFASETIASVPTQRIWARIENEIDALAWQPQAIKAEDKTVWTRLNLIFTAPQIAFAGGLAGVILISLFSLNVLEQSLPNQSDVALNDNSFDSQTLKPVSLPNSPILTKESSEKSVNEPKAAALRFVKASYEPQPSVRKTNLEKSPSANRRLPALDKPLAEEKDYLNSIEQLAKTVETSDEAIMRPSFRVEYERNMAMMDRAIAAMQKQVRLNPRDENAKRFLLASYQNKIDLLSAVSEKSQLMASVR